MRFKELDVVKTLIDFPEEKIGKGEIGTIVLIHTVPREGYEVEFVNDDGETKAVFAILPDDIEKVLY